jgi:hypothetical protein
MTHRYQGKKIMNPVSVNPCLGVLFDFFDLWDDRIKDHINCVGALKLLLQDLEEWVKPDLQFDHHSINDGLNCLLGWWGDEVGRM